MMSRFLAREMLYQISCHSHCCYLQSSQKPQVIIHKTLVSVLCTNVTTIMGANINSMVSLFFTLCLALGGQLVIRFKIHRLADRPVDTTTGSLATINDATLRNCRNFLILCVDVIFGLIWSPGICSFSSSTFLFLMMHLTLITDYFRYVTVSQPISYLVWR